MPIKMILLPVFVQVALTFAVLIWMARARIAAFRNKQVTAAAVALGQPNWPQKAQQLTNSFNNQLQLPMLFYALTLLAIVTRQADLLFVVMAWLFVLTRLVHASIHTASNNMRHRLYAFATGAMVLLVMWIIFAGKILLGV